MSVLPVGFSTNSSYPIARSARFRGTWQNYLTKTPTQAATSRRRLTWSGWVKRGSLGALTPLFGTSDSGASAGYGTTFLAFQANGTLRFVTSRASDGQTFIWFDTTAVFIDSASHYHIQVAIDLDQASAANGFRLWVNNKLQTGTMNFYLPGNDMFANHTVPQYVGRQSSLSPSYMDGHMSEIHMIDGQTLTPGSFGAYDGRGVWSPKPYSGTYGTNGYYLPFANGNSITELGFDCKPNSFMSVPAAGVVGAQISTADFPFGTSSLYVDGNYGSYVLYAADSRNVLTPGVYSIKMWVKDLGKTSPPAYNILNTCISQGDNAGNAFWRLSIDNNSRQLYWGYTGSAVVVSATYPVSAGVWHELVVTRDSSNVERIFIDGMLVNVRTNTTNYAAASGLYVHLGASYDTNYPGSYGVNARHGVLRGYLKDVTINGGNIPVEHRTTSTTVGAQIWTPNPSPIVTNAKTNVDWAYTGLYVQAEGPNASTSIPTTGHQHFGPVGFSIAPDRTNDWSRDTPSTNYATFNPLYIDPIAATMSWANTQASAGDASNGRLRWLTHSMRSGRWYVEFTVTTFNSNTFAAGIIPVESTYAAIRNTGNTNVGSRANEYGYGSSLGSAVRIYNNVYTNLPNTVMTNGDTLGLAYDADGRTLQVYLNGIQQTVSGFTSIPQGDYYFAISCPLGTFQMNAGQRPFVSPPPSGYLPLCAANMAPPAIALPKYHFDITSYVGDSTDGRAITIPNFDPDLVWTKGRTVASHHYLTDRIRSDGRVIITSAANAESPYTGYFNWGALGTRQYYISRNGSGGVDDGYNVSGSAYVGWAWKGGNGTVASTLGIPAQINRNTQAGFAIVSYTGTGSNGILQHGLNWVPGFYMIKSRTQALNWTAWHYAFTGAGAGGGDTYITVNSNAAMVTGASAVWAGAPPTTSFINLGTDSAVNAAGQQYIMYAFTEVPGFSKFGVYTGHNDQLGPFVNCGFTPRWVMIKGIDTVSDWWIFDSTRNPINKARMGLYAQLINIETQHPSGGIDFLSNGFRVSLDGGYNPNVLNQRYIFLAFAEYPFKYARAV